MCFSLTAPTTGAIASRAKRPAAISVAEGDRELVGSTPAPLDRRALPVVKSEVQVAKQGLRVALPDRTARSHLREKVAQRGGKV